MTKLDFRPAAAGATGATGATARFSYFFRRIGQESFPLGDSVRTFDV